MIAKADTVATENGWRQNSKTNCLKLPYRKNSGRSVVDIIESDGIIVVSRCIVVVHTCDSFGSLASKSRALV